MNNYLTSRAHYLEFNERKLEIVCVNKKSASIVLDVLQARRLESGYIGQ